MTLFGLTITRSKSQPALQTRSPGGESIAWLKGEEPAGHGLTVNNAYQQVVWVYRAINVLAEQVANIPFLFSRGDRGRENLITQGPLIHFYDHPHPQFDRFQYWELRIIWLMLCGECFRIPIFEEANAAGGLTGSRVAIPEAPRSGRRLDRVLILDPAQFQHIVDDHRLIGWRYRGFGPGTPLESQVFLPEEVWFEKLPNPFNFWRGMAPLQVAALAAQTDFAAGSFMKGVMENNGDLGLVVRAQEQMGPEQREQLRAALRDRRRRAGTANEPLLLWNTAEIIQPQLSSSDLQFLENRKFSRAEICAAFGVPEEIVTTTDHSKYDVMEGARLNFIEHRVAPLCRRLEASEAVTVKALDGSAVGWFDLDSVPVLQKAQRDRLVAARSAFDMGVPFNELNRVLDLGFRHLPWGDRGYVASRLIQVGEELDKAKMKSFAAPDWASFWDRPDTGRGLEPPQRALELLEALRSQGSELAGNSEGAVEVPIRHNSRRSPLHPCFQKKLHRFYFEQRARVLAALSRTRAEEQGILGPVRPFDLPAENQRATEFLIRWSRTERADPISGVEDPQEFSSIIHSFNRTLQETVCTSLEAGVQAQEPAPLLSARVRSIYNCIPELFDWHVQKMAEAVHGFGRRMTPGQRPQ